MPIWRMGWQWGATPFKRQLPAAPHCRRRSQLRLPNLAVPRLVRFWRKTTRAEIAPLSIDRMVERFGDVAAIRDALLARDNLPAASRQDLVTRLSQTLAGFVVDRAWLEEDRARRIAREACEKATVTIAADSPQAELRPLIRHLCVSGQLTAGLVLRALL